MWKSTFLWKSFSSFSFIYGTVLGNPNLDTLTQILLPLPTSTVFSVRHNGSLLFSHISGLLLTVCYLFSSRRKLCHRLCAYHSDLKLKFPFGNYMSQARRERGGWGGFSPPPPVFGQTVTPIPTRGADFTHRSSKSPPGISDLATGLIMT